MDIKKYEAMAKLDLSETERERVTEKAKSLIQSFSALDSIDLTGTEPLITVLDSRNVLRDDEVKKMMSREELLAGAPDKHEGFFRLPRVID